MPLSQASHIRPLYTFSIGGKLNYLSSKSAWNNRRRVLQTFARSRCMSTASFQPDLQERSSKRRKTTTISHQSIHASTIMESISVTQSPQLQLTPVEVKLRQLLLDVASHIDNSPAQEHVIGVQVPQDLTKEPVTLRWTGGWVRDKLLQVESHDIDLAINKMTGEQFGLRMQEYLELPGNADKHGLVEKNAGLDDPVKAKKIAPGLHKIEANPEKSKNLETATTRIMGIDLDLVNLRKETYNETSRNPIMEFGTAEEDAVRRDATVNAMFYNLHTCEVEDFTQLGHRDMAAKIIRTPLEPLQTFKDDPLRVLRLIRFASRLDYTIEPATAKAMENLEIQEALKIKISRERVGIEIEKMLRGPRPHMALELINKFDLYQTVFTDPTRELPGQPETSYFLPSCNIMESLMGKNKDVPTVITHVLVRDEEERYLAWISAALIPWADCPPVAHPKPTQRPFFAAYLVAREGLKAPNKVCDVITAALGNGEEIRRTVSQCTKEVRQRTFNSAPSSAAARDTLGMAIRRWGATWRTQIVFNMVYEMVLGHVSRQVILESYATFLGHVSMLNILDADTLRPLIKGTDLAKALQTKPGPWMKDALDVVMAWQLRHPEKTVVEEAIQAVKASRDDMIESELSSRLAMHFLQLTIPTLFSQSRAGCSVPKGSHQAAPWKEKNNEYVVDILAWSIGRVHGKELEKMWSFMVPPVLKMVDDADVAWKVKGCTLLEHVVQQSLQQDRHAGPRTGNLIKAKGYDVVFSEALFPLLGYLPSLTPENDSVALFNAAYGALLRMSEVDVGGDEQKLVERLLREGMLQPLGYLAPGSTYPELTACIVSHFPMVFDRLGIELTKHVGQLVPLLSSMLQEPFALSHERLVLSVLKAMQGLLQNAWPRLGAERGEMMMGLCVLWRRCMEEQEGDGTRASMVERVKRQTKETVDMMGSIMMGLEEAEQVARGTWQQQKEAIQAALGELGPFGRG